MFLPTAELKTVSTVEIINLITNSDETTVQDIVKECIDTMKGYIHKYYDTEVIFSAVGNDRSLTVLKHLKALVIFDLFLIRNKDVSPEMEKKYDEAMRWLEKIAKGEIEPDLPKKQVDTDGDGTADSNSTFMKLGSRKNHKNHW